MILRKTLEDNYPMLNNPQLIEEISEELTVDIFNKALVNW